MIFLDTSFLIADLVRADAHHQTAQALRRRLESARLVTTNHVRGEAWTYVNRRLGHTAACTLIDSLERSPRLSISQVSADLEREALSWLRDHDEREYSFVDATSFALMRGEGIHEALAFDGDFGAAGFVELRPALNELGGSAEPRASFGSARR